MNHKTTFQLMNLIPPTRDRRRSMNWQVLYVSLMRLTKTLALHIKSYFGGILDLDILGYNMSNG